MMVDEAQVKTKTDMGLRERIRGVLSFLDGSEPAEDQPNFSSDLADQIVPICIETLAERFNSYLDEMIFDYQCVPPLSENHRKLVATRLDTYKWVKRNFERIVKEIENDHR